MPRRILVVDDMEFNRKHLQNVLSADGFDVETLGDGRSAWDELRVQKYHLLITDLRMPEMSGLDLLERVRADKLPIGVILLTAYGDVNEALDAMKKGADDFITKPCDVEHLRFLIKRILERRALIDEFELLRKRLRGDYKFHSMVSKSPKMRKLFELIKQVGPSGSTVLVQGETGTGKELVAHALHAADPRGGAGPFVALNCAVLNDSLLETELFGHEKGAFTGAERRKMGRFELADGGTLLLDEIGDMPLVLQSKLLRVLQSGTFERVGGHEPVKVRVRIIAATHKNLEQEVKLGRFRADLFYRLNVIRVEIPPLRERTEDIPILAMHFLQKHQTDAAAAVTEIDTEAMQTLLRHGWPGNVRELENAIKAGIALSHGHILVREHLPESVAPRIGESSGGRPVLDVERALPELTDDLIGRVECDYFRRLLVQYRGNVARCARHSGLSRRSVTQKLQKYGLDRADFKKTLSEARSDS
jgi:DNA-binding NtrC family response regulator